mgnify:CR=1 FL=1
MSSSRAGFASLDDEAELAAASGHELGHLGQHHAAQRARARQGVLDAAVEAAVVTGSPTVGRSVARDGLLGAQALLRANRSSKPIGSACRCSCAPAIAATPWPA